jgi:nicotinamide riboside kinase
MIRVGFTGAPGTGKTTTARAFSSYLRKYNFHHIELVHEYARRYISKHGSIEKMWEQMRVTSKQVEWENSVTNSKLEILITDSPVFLGFFYACDLERKCEKDIMVFNDLFKTLNRLNFPEPRYDIVFHLPPVLKSIDDGVRVEKHLDNEWRLETDVAIKHIFKIFPPKQFIEVPESIVSIEDRVDFCLNYIHFDWKQDDITLSIKEEKINLTEQDLFELLHLSPYLLEKGQFEADNFVFPIIDVGLYTIKEKQSNEQIKIWVRRSK